MSISENKPGASLSLAADLDARTVGAVHAGLLSALDEIETSDVSVLRLDLTYGDVGPLALQLLVSISRSVPAARLRLGERAVTALAALDQSKEI